MAKIKKTKTSFVRYCTGKVLKLDSLVSSVISALNNNMVFAIKFSFT